jgi:putative flippase GtrA
LCKKLEGDLETGGSATPRPMGQNARYLLGYLLCGGCATFLDFSVFLVLTDYFGIWYFHANFVSYPLGMSTNFILNKVLNFRNKYRGYLRQFGIFVLIGLLGLVVNQWILYSLVESFGFFPLLAKAVALGIVVAWNFTANRYLTFELMK